MTADEFRHETYWVPMPTTQMGSLSVGRGRNQQRRGKNASAKLTQAEVAEIRRWAGSTGMGLGVTAQARVLAAMYPGVSVETLRQILRNEAWHDPDYDRTRPVVVASNPRWLLHCPQWLLALVLLCQTYRR